ncbi:MAG TPA: aspartate/glutamate racemase family protein [Cyclobacteriaceae bacterium]|nr:aspartate/glutamate racemase family protein [Cyclobacteriaceae bacterium]
MIAIIDYGIGGLGLYKMIREEFPSAPVTYFSDSGEIPYGKLSKRVLRARLERVFKFLERRGATQIIVACHSASSVVLPTDINVTGLRPQTIKAVTKRKPRSVGIIGGGRTIRSGFYRRELGKAGIKTKQRVAQPLSILVERGEVKGKAVEEAVAKIVKPLAGCDSILLACTHYPVLSAEIAKHAPHSKLIDPVQELYNSVRHHFNKKSKGVSEFLTTGNTGLMIAAAQKAFGVAIPRVVRVKL